MKNRLSQMRARLRANVAREYERTRDRDVYIVTLPSQISIPKEAAWIGLYALIGAIVSAYAGWAGLGGFLFVAAFWPVFLLGAVIIGALKFTLLVCLIICAIYVVLKVIEAMD